MFEADKENFRLWDDCLFKFFIPPDMQLFITKNDKINGYEEYAWICSKKYDDIHVGIVLKYNGDRGAECYEKYIRPGILALAEAIIEKEFPGYCEIYNKIKRRRISLGFDS